MSVTLVDTPFSNRRNIVNALARAGATVTLSSDAAEIAAADTVILPGVGAFSTAMQWLRERRIDIALKDAVARHAMLLGVCLGYQLLFESSTEMGSTLGLGFLRGEVTSFQGTQSAPPKIGWNSIQIVKPSALFVGIADQADMYFVHSFRVERSVDCVAVASCGGRFVAAAERGNVFGVQFHPEKSSVSGARVINNFVQLAARCAA